MRIFDEICPCRANFGSGRPGRSFRALLLVSRARHRCDFSSNSPRVEVNLTRIGCEFEVNLEFTKSARVGQISSKYRRVGDISKSRKISV